MRLTGIAGCDILPSSSVDSEILMTVEQTAAVNLIDTFMHYARGAGATVEVVGLAQVAALIAGWRQGALKCTAAVREQYPDLVQALAAPVAEEITAGLDRSAVGAALA